MASLNLKLKNVISGGTILLSMFFVLFPETSVQGVANRPEQRVRKYRRDTLGLNKGTVTFETPDFILKLVRASQTVAALQPRGIENFDFTPSDRLEQRSGDGFYHLGDLNLRIRTGESGDWISLSTAAVRKPILALEVSNNILMSADLSPTLPEHCPLRITRTWALDDACLVLRFELTNQTDFPVYIGALGIPMIFNNIITGRSLKQAHEVCSFSDPYIGLDAGYLQVTRLSGQGPVLLVVPQEVTHFEAYQLLREPMPVNQTFEGIFEWLVHSRAFAENEWKDVDPWNPASEAVIMPGQSRTYGVKFLVSKEIRDIESTLTANNRPVTVTVPGTILPSDLDGKLFLKYISKVADIDVEPKNAIDLKPTSLSSKDWQAFILNGKRWGRCRLKVTYVDGHVQSIHYFVIKPSAQVVADMGQFLFDRQWFVDTGDIFRRSPSVMGYDREENAIVLQDNRVWIAGLGDEAGSGSWVAAAMKEFGQPKKRELAKYEKFVDSVLWGGIQYSSGSRQYGVRKSMFYYAPDEMPKGYYKGKFDWSSWASWDKQVAMSVKRSYNYPHVATVYWVMYRLARYYNGLVTGHPWQWYLERAFQTGQAMVKYAGQYASHGQMEGTIFLKILMDLKREGWVEQASAFEATMKKRADLWKEEAYPFGSEMAWDSTGQEEVYAWCKYFGYVKKAQVSLNSILGYMPTIPHWGYNGNARRYWDFLYGGKLRRIERQLHHYGSGLNAIPVLSEYRDNPDDFYLLRVGYGGTMGALSNIDQDGFASAAFHSFPSTLKWDSYSGDYGPNFFGHALNTGTYIIRHPEFGWLAFGGNIREKGNMVEVDILDSLRRRVYIAPFGLWLTLDSGSFEQVKINRSDQSIILGLSASTPYLRTGRLRIEQPAKIVGIGKYLPGSDLGRENGAFRVPLISGTTWIVLHQTR